jgi:multiple sugar transport system substrate-binding protein/sn-glycerol 3-phosphate transport system substrate-binding protein
MNMKRFFALFTLLLVFTLVFSACGQANDNVEPNEPEVEAPAADEPAVEEPAEEPAAEEPAEEMLDLSGVTVEFWHMYGEGERGNEAISAVVDEFNATNEYGITVEHYGQGRTSDVQSKVNTALQSGDYPNIVRLYTSDFFVWDEFDVVTDLAPFINDADYGLTAEEIADFYPVPYQDGFKEDGRILSFPFSQSGNLPVYNFTWAQELGFPNPPTTSAELKEQLCAAAEANATDDNPDNDSGKGMVWAPTNSNFELVMFAFGASILNEAGDGYDFNTPEAVQAALYINDLRDSGCIFTTENYPNPEQAQRLALITLSSTAGRYYYQKEFDAIESTDEWGFIYFPGPEGQVSALNWIQNIGILTGTPEEDLASWLFIKYLSEPENQAMFVEETGYLPTRASTAVLLEDYIANTPGFESAMEVLEQGTGEPNGFPAWGSVRYAFYDTAAELFAAESEEEIIAILEAFNVEAAELLAEATE